MTAAVAAGSGFGVEQYPDAIPDLEIARGVICAAANGTNVAPDQVVASLVAAGVNNPHSKLIVNGSLAIYNTVFAFYGNDYVKNTPTLQLYLGAVCDGLVMGVPPRPQPPPALGHLGKKKWKLKKDTGLSPRPVGPNHLL